MFILDQVLVFTFGLVIGSFLNVVIYRYNTGRTVGGRSRCGSCRKVLRWYELLPVASYLAQWGKCRECLTKISWQYPVVELLTGFVFVLVYRIAPNPDLTALYWAIFCLLIVILVYDFRHKIIPDAMVFGFIALSAVEMWWTGDWQSGLLAGGGLFVFFGLLWLLSRGRWMGFGDAKLAIGIGFLLGFPGGISAVILAFWVGAAVGIVLLLLQKISPKRKLPRTLRYLTMKSEVPFAPFLILGLALNFFLAINVIPTF